MSRPSRRSKSDRRSLVRDRGVLYRVLGYAFPYWKSIAAALAISMFSSVVGGVSLLAMIPMIQYVLDQETAAKYEERAETFRQEEEAKIGKIEEAQELGGNALENLGVRLAWVSKTEAWLSARKETVRAAIYDFLDRRGFSAIKYIALILIGGALIKACMDVFGKYQLARVLFKGMQKIKVDLYASVLGLDLGHFQTRTSGNLISRLSSDVVQISTILRSALTQSVTTPFRILAILGVLFIISVEVTLVMMVALPIIALPIIILSKKLRRLSKLDAEEDAYLVDVMQETMHGLQIVKAFGSESHERDRFRTEARAMLRRQIRRMRLAIFGPALMEVLGTAAICLVLLVGAYVVIVADKMEAPEFMVYLLALQQFYRPLKNISSGVMRIQRGLASAERIFEIIDTRPQVVEKPGAVALAPLREQIEFRDVCFSYSGEREIVLQHFDLVVPRGKTVALVGPTGSGKSTVTKLLPRFYDPSEGAILIDGVDIRDVTFNSLRDQISIVTQETILFDETIYYNIAYGKWDATMEDVERVAKTANIHDYIMSLPQGYETRIGERGGQLSGGQRQRLAIARALLRDSPILILDEATSALDNETEASIQRELDRLMENRTVLIIAHRLSTIRNADTIVVLDGGRIVEQGSNEELLGRGGKYAELSRAESAEARRSRDSGSAVSISMSPSAAT